MPPALVVGLTGGLASGKSTVARLFEELGAPVIDADAIAREVVAPGEPALDAIRACFGNEMLNSDGSLDRARLREAVFSSPDQRRALEKILHPRIRARMNERLAALDAPYAILMVPLLLETGQDATVDRVLVVDAPRALQLERARARDGSRANTLEGILQAQLNRETRLDRADDVIVNDGSMEALRADVRRLHEVYRAPGSRLRVPKHQ